MVLAELSLSGLASAGLALVSGLAAAKTYRCRHADATMYVAYAAGWASPDGPAMTSSRSFATLRIHVKFCYLHLVGFSLSACSACPVSQLDSCLLQLLCD